MNKFLNIIILLSIILSCNALGSSAKIKKSALSGSWYSSNPIELTSQIDRFFEKSEIYRRKAPLVLILPHAGYAYSGKTAAYGYRFLGLPGKSSCNTDLIILIGPSHYAGFHGCMLLDVDYIETPLGKVKINREVVGRLSGDRLFRKDSSPFDLEHSIEIQLPFLQRIFREKMAGNVQVVPILVGEIDDAEAERAARFITAAIEGARPLFIISSDFTHYGEYFRYEPFRHIDARTTAAELKKLDTGAIDLILKKDLEGFSGYCGKTGITICGRNPVRIALALPIEGFESKLAAYDTSGATTGDYSRSVSYAAVMFSGKLMESHAGAGDDKELTLEDRAYLLKKARDNISSWLTSGKGLAITAADAPKNTQAKRGVFVTLKKGGSLRGCIGYVTGMRPLVLAVLENSYNAAFKDPRFKPLDEAELKEIAIEISVLTVPQEVRELDEIQVGRDGLIVERGSNRGLLLPQVATEQGWDRDAFLDQTCCKAGLRPGTWKDPHTRLLRFRAEVFGEDRR